MRKMITLSLSIVLVGVLCCGSAVQALVFSAADSQNDVAGGRANAISFICGIIRNVHWEESSGTSYIVFTPVIGFHWTLWDEVNRFPSIPVPWFLWKMSNDYDLWVDPGIFSGVLSGFFILGFLRHSVATP